MLDALTGIFPVRHVAVTPQERQPTFICTHPDLLDILAALVPRVLTLNMSLACIVLQLDQPGVGALTYSDEERKVASRLVASNPRGHRLEKRLLSAESAPGVRACA